jgi:hypothetical protein
MRRGAATERERERGANGQRTSQPWVIATANKTLGERVRASRASTHRVDAFETPNGAKRADCRAIRVAEKGRLRDLALAGGAFDIGVAVAGRAKEGRGVAPGTIQRALYVALLIIEQGTACVSPSIGMM